MYRFTIICLITALICNGCNQIDSSSHQKQIQQEETLSNDYLVLQAREGDVDAYISLAENYHHGTNVDKSWSNMIYMYSLYLQKTDKTYADFLDLIEHWDDKDPYKTLSEFFFSDFDDIPIKNIDKIEESAPVEAEVLKILVGATSFELLPHLLEKIGKAEEDGSEIAILVQVIYYQEIGDKKELEKCYMRAGMKYPFYYNLLGNLYIDEYHETNDISYLHKCIDSYYLADAKGMLNPRSAKTLIGIFNNHEIPTDEKEMERLKLLAY